jgi:surface polysaccharide O-acyltransferase-like enzyme
LDSVERVAVPLLLIQATSVVFLWSLDTLGQVSQTIFTLFLAADLLSFALMAHVYRTNKAGTVTGNTYLFGSILVILIFFVAGLIVT